MPIRSNLAFLAAGVALACLVQPASASTRQVGACTTNPLQYATIQAAVSAAKSGDKVEICPGTYAEQVVVSQAMTLENVPGQASPTVAVPAGGVAVNTQTLDGTPAAAQIVVAPAAAASVNIENLIVDGTGNNDACSFELIGIYYRNAGGTISGNTAQNQLQVEGYQGCQFGEGIFVENQTKNTAKVKISGNTVSNFDKNGITVSYTAANAAVENNIVTGLGPTDVIAQNGIQVGYGATGSISDNQLSGMIFTPATYGSAAILLYDSQAGAYIAPPKISNNTISNAQYGIVLDAVDGTASKTVQIKSNGISGAAFAGIGLYSDNSYNPPLSDDYIKVQGNTISGTTPYDGIDVCSDNNLIKGNTVSDSAEGGIHLDGLCTEADGSASGINNSVSSNTIEDNCVGVLSGGAPGENLISKSNTFIANTNNYIYNSDSYSCSAPRRSGAAEAGSATQMPGVQPR